ncbi:hypothetical protein N0V84_005617 [Fusarium piperis]|uniref:Uncharacterized protein n=1 Tax=Fusarium piperis TaxID=1435070 RepID=A0A9W8WDQ9_9HYPO|nr:hypothetical protein N0V84_005617 [Fusarium piperis]
MSQTTETRRRRRNKHDSSRRSQTPVKKEQFELGKREDDTLWTSKGGLGGAPQETNPPFATIRLRERPYRKLLQDEEIPLTQIPETAQVHYFDPEILGCGIDRTACIVLLRHLSEEPAKVVVWDSDCGLVTEKSGVDVDLATVLILSVALRDVEHVNFAGELLGLAPLETVERMRPFLRPPFLDSLAIVNLTHGAARHISQVRNGNNGRHGDYRLLKVMSSAIASLLQWPDDFLAENPIDWFVEAINEIFTTWKDDSDRGLQVGLLLVGEEKFLQGILAKAELKADWGITLLKSIHGAASGAPVAGFVASAVEPWFERAAIALKDKKLAEYKDAWCQIWQGYSHNFRNDIILYGEVKIGDGSYKVTEMFLRFVEIVMDDEKPLRAF